MSATIKNVDPRAEIDTPANVQPVESGEAASSMTASPDTQEILKMVALIQLEALVEQYDEIEKKYQRAKELRKDLRFRIRDVAQQAGLQMPFKCAAGRVVAKPMRFFSGTNRHGALTPSQRRQARRCAATELVVEAA